MPRTPNACARCGERPPEPGQLLCAQCREEVGPAARDASAAPVDTDLDERRTRWPATMVKPSPVQYHATILVTIAVVLLGLGVWAFLSHRGVGPFEAQVTSRTPYGNSTQSIVVTVTNKGSRGSKATCTFRALDSVETELATVTVLTEPISGHGSIAVTQVFRHLSEEPAGYDTVCT